MQKARPVTAGKVTYIPPGYDDEKDTCPHLMNAGPALSRHHRRRRTQVSQPQPIYTQIGAVKKQGLNSNVKYQARNMVLSSWMQSSMNLPNLSSEPLLATTGILIWFWWVITASHCAFLGQRNAMPKGTPIEMATCNPKTDFASH